MRFWKLYRNNQNEEKENNNLPNPGESEHSEELEEPQQSDSETDEGQSSDEDQQTDSQNQNNGTLGEPDKEFLSSEQNNPEYLQQTSDNESEDSDQEEKQDHQTNDNQEQSQNSSNDEQENFEAKSNGESINQSVNPSSGISDNGSIQDTGNIPQDSDQTFQPQQSDLNKDNSNPVSGNEQPLEFNISEQDVLDMPNNLQNQEPNPNIDDGSSQNIPNDFKGEEHDNFEDNFDSSKANNTSEEPSQDLTKETKQQTDSSDNGVQTDNEENIDERKEKLQAISDRLKQLLSQVNQHEKNQNKTVEEVKKQLEKSHLTGEKETPIESTEKDYDLSNANQELLNRLNEIMPFKDRDRGPGYAIDTNGHTDVPDSVIRTLINRFLNQRFIKRDTDLNVRSNSLEKTSGFHKWDVKAVVTHLQTHQITKVLTDKYGYKYDDGKNENIPLSFYFDLSGSMESYTNLLSTIAIELLKKNVKVLVGFNERVNYQIDSINKVITVDDLAKILTRAGNYYEQQIYNSNVKLKKINRNIDNYLLSSKSEKCVVFSDFDPLDEVVNLSKRCNVYWFCFENRFDRSDLGNFNGFIYPVQNIQDIALGLLRVSDYRFETLCYFEKENGRGKVMKL